MAALALVFEYTRLAVCRASWQVALVKPVTLNMINQKPDAGYEKMWEAQQDDLYILQEGEEQTLPARAQSFKKPPC
jgi:hypothetical protein